MKDRDKLFIAYRHGPFGLQMVPKDRRGWRAMLRWIAVFLGGTGLFVWHATSEPKGAELYLALAIFISFASLWAFGLIRWTRANSEMVDIAELLAIKREQERQKGRR
jgi:hypothetical protein